eukprot:761776-Hanusia_phi.AAC.6
MGRIGRRRPAAACPQSAGGSKRPGCRRPGTERSVRRVRPEAPRPVSVTSESPFQRLRALHSPGAWRTLRRLAQEMRV